MRQMTRGQVVAVVRRMGREAGGLRALCARHQVHPSTLSNMLHGRNTWTRRALRLLGLDDVQVVDGVVRHTPTVEPAQTIRPYIPMWRLGDWPVWRHGKVSHFES